MSAASTSSNMGGAAQDMTTNPAWPQKQSHSLRPSTAPVRRSRAVSSRQINYAMPPASEAGSEPDGGPQGEGGEGAAPANKKPKVWSRMRSQAPDHQKWKESVSKVPGSEYYNRNAYELSSADMARYHQLAINVDQGGPHIPGAYSRPLSAGGLGKTTGQLGGGPGMIGQGASLAATMPGGQHVTDRPASAYHRLEQTQTGEFRPPVARPEERAPVDGHGHLISRGRSRGNYTNEVFGDQLGLPGGTAELRGAGRAAQMRTRGGGANLNNTLGSGSGGELLDEQDLALVRGDATLKSRLAVHEQEDDPAALMESYTKRKKEQYLGTTGTDFDETTGEKIKLPFGWTKHRAKVEGERKSYYYNRFTGESKWERPTGVAVGDLMQTDVEKTRKEEMNEEQRQAEMRRVAAIEANVTEGDGLHDVDENLPDIVLFFIIIYRYLRTNYRRLKKQLKKAFEKQADEGKTRLSP
ncbi:unnamed protein product [Amoebophrya sp. A25]|nr:unnamed protein product [Amoebophrya sp. A25]|eukprot:GSA25T00004969001.1